MWTSFICPDEVPIKIEDCINECRMDRRCVAKPTLIVFSRGRRQWKGKISTTQALNGTRLEFLRLKHDYGEAPCDRAFALAGTQHHLRYQKIEIPGALYEEWMEDEEGTGMFDYYDAETFELYDFKLIGGYKVNRILGKFSEEVPVAGEFFKSGPRKGQPRTQKVWAMRDPDNFEYRMQLSRYGWMLRDAGFRVDYVLLQATVRDWTEQTSKQYGLDRKIYLIEISMFDRDTVVNFYRARRDALLKALETDTMPDVCSPEERWNDRRCQKYCVVWNHCDHGRQVRATPLPKDGDSVF